MTTNPQPTETATAEPTTEEPAVSAPAKALPQQRSQRTKGDVHVSSMGGDVRPVPGSGTAKGDKAIADVMRDVLDRVRRSIRERNGANRSRR